jgi:uncharacterized protein
MRREDWTLLAISVAGGKGLSPVQLQKTLFLVGRRLPQGDLGDAFYNFEPYNYGPFDVSIYQDAEMLEGRGLVAISRSNERRWAQYLPTPDGVRAAGTLRERANPRAVAYLEQVVAWAMRLSFRDLVRAIYAEFPEFRINSVFQDCA